MGLVSILLLASQASSEDVVDDYEDYHKIEIGDLAAQQQDNSGPCSEIALYGLLSSVLLSVLTCLAQRS